MTARILIFAFLSFCVALTPQTKAHAQTNDAPAQFAQTLSDLPLMPGSSEDITRSVDFDTPEGRIAEFSLVVPSADAAIAFYNDALPSLGWIAQNSAGHTWQREGDLMTLAPEGAQRLHIEHQPATSFFPP